MSGTQSLSSARRLVPAILILVALPALHLAAWGGDEASELMARARRHLVQRHPDEAIPCLEALLEQRPAGELADEARVLLGRAELLAGRAEAAERRLLAAIEAIGAESPWRAKARYLLAGAAEARGDHERAAAVYRDEAARVDGADFRRELAARFSRLAREQFEPKKPDDPLAVAPEPDYGRAATLWGQAEGILTGGRGRHAELAWRIATCRFRQGERAQALAIVGEILEQYGPKSPAPDATATARARLLAGRIHLAEGRRGEARRVLTQLAATEAARDPELGELPILLGESFGLPETRDRGALRAGLAHWDEFLERHPSDERCEELRRRKIHALRHAGAADEAVRAARDYLVHHKSAEGAPRVLREIADIHLGAGDHDDARAALREFLVAFPDDPAVPAARAKLPQILFEKGRRLHAADRPQAALAAWTAFLEEYPVHAEAARVAVEIGRLHLTAGRIEEARRAWTMAHERYREADPPRAALAGFLLGTLLEEQDGDLERAVKQYRQVVESFPKSEAAHLATAQIAGMEAIELGLEAPPVFRTDEEARVELVLRNVKEATMRLYPIDLEAYFRAKRTTQGFDRLDIALVKPARSWKVAPGSYRRYRRERIDVSLPAPEGERLEPGAWVVTAEDGTRRSLAVVLVSDLRLIVKQGARQVFVFAQDVRQRRPVPGARILVADRRRRLAEGRTNDDGVFVAELDERQDRRRVLGIAGDQLAPGCLTETPAGPRPVFGDRGWLATDRPVYRPGETVHVFGILRRGGRDGYRTPAAKTPVELTLRDGEGGLVAVRRAELTEFGTLAAAFELPPESGLGDFSIRCELGGLAVSRAFEVKAFHRAAFTVEVAAADDEGFAAKPGEKVPVVVTVRDFFGNTVSGARVFWKAWRSSHGFERRRLIDDPWRFAHAAPAPDDTPAEPMSEGAGVTDDGGVLRFELATDAAEEASRYRIAATVVGEDRITHEGSGFVYTGLRSFDGVVTTARDVYRTGDVIRAEVVTVGPSFRPVSRTGVLRLMARARPKDDLREVARTTLSTGLDGRGRATLEVPVRGELALQFTAEGARGETVTLDSHAPLRALDFEEAADLRLAADRRMLFEGESLRALLGVPSAGRPVLLTFEGERVIDYRIVTPKSRSETISWELSPRHIPGVFVSAAMIHDRKLRTASDQIAVRRWLDVTIETDRQRYSPGDRVRVKVTTRDQAGRAVPAELGLFVTDRAVLALGKSEREDIRDRFRPTRRRHTVTTSCTVSFAFHTGARMIDADLVEEARRNARFKSLREHLGSLDKAGLELSLEEAEVVDEDESAKEKKAIGLGGGAGGAFGGRHGGRRRSQDARDRAVRKSAAAFAVPALAAASPGERSKALERMTPADASVADIDAESRPAIEPRRRILPVAHVAPLIRTDAGGTAEIELTLPDNLTRWRLEAWGTSSDALVGRGESDIVADKPLLVTLAEPRFLTQGDRTQARAIVENHGRAPADVELTLAAGGAVEVATPPRAKSRLAAGARTASDFELAAVARGQGRVTASVSAGAASDGLEQPLAVLPFGRKMISGGRGRLDGEALLDFPVDGEITPGTGRCVLVVSRGLAGDIVDATAVLTRRRHSTVEACASRLVALLKLLDLADVQGALPLRRATIESNARRELRSLVASRRSDGSFGWCPRSGSDPFVTALALEALGAATAHGMLETPAALEDARTAAEKLLGRGHDPLDADAALLFALSTCGRMPVAHLNRVARASAKLSSTGLAWLTLAAHASDREVQARQLTRLLEGRLVAAEGTVHARGHASCTWISSEREASAWALRALIARDRAGGRLDGLAEFLRSRRTGGGFGTTKTTAVAVAALAGYAARQGLSEAGGKIDVSLDGERLASLEVGSGGAGSIVHRIPFERLKAGSNRLALKSTGLAATHFSLLVDWYRPADHVPADPGAFDVHRAVTAYRTPEERANDVVPGYQVLKPDSRPHRGPPVGLREVEQGGRYSVVIDVEAKAAQEYVVLEDPLPAGLDVFELSVSGPFSHVERRDDRMLFYFARLPEGTTRVEYTAYAAFAGRYRAAPAQATVLYDPRIRGNDADLALEILPERAAVGREEARTPTPDEAYAAGRRAFDEGRWTACVERLSPLLELDLRDDVRRRVMLDLLLSRLRSDDWSGAVRDYENVQLDRARPPELGRSDLVRLGRAFAAVRDFERAREIWSAVVQDAFREELGFGRALLELEGPAEGQEHILAACLRYPDSDLVAETWFDGAEAWFDIPDPRRADRVELPEVYRARYERGLEETLRAMSHLPRHRGEEAAAAGLLERYRALGMVSKLEAAATDFLARHEDSVYAQDAQLLLLRAYFARGAYDEARAAAQRLTEKRWYRIDGTTKRRGSSRHRSIGRYHLGKIAHIEGRIDEAVRYYEQVKDEFSDAAQSYLFFTEQTLSIPAVVTLEPDAPHVVAARLKNVAGLTCSLYGVDLPLVFTVRKSLGNLHKVDLTGIAPDRRWNVEPALERFREHEHPLDLGRLDVGAYLLVVDDGHRRRSSIVVVSPLEVTQQRHGSTLRVYVTNAATGKPVSGATVRAGDGSAIVATGRTDERGILVLRNVPRRATVLAAKDQQYALGR